MCALETRLIRGHFGLATSTWEMPGDRVTQERGYSGYHERWTGLYTASLARNYNADASCDFSSDDQYTYPMYTPGLNFSAQNDVRVGLQWEDFLGKCSSKLLRLFGLHWASKGGKMV